MALYDPSKQLFSTIPSSVTATNTLAATPLSFRSLSAPSIIALPEIRQDVFMTSQASQAGQDFAYQQQQHHQQQQQQQQQHHHHQHQQQHHHQQQQQQYQQQQQILNAQFQSTTSMPAFSQPYILHHQLPPMVRSNTNYTYQGSVHPFQMDATSSPVNGTEYATPSRFPLDFSNDPFSRQANTMFTQEMDDAQPSNASCSPSSSSSDGSSPTIEAPFGTHAAPRLLNRVHSMPMALQESDLSQLELHEEFAPTYHITRHGSLDSMYPLLQAHEYSEAAGYTVSSHSRFDMSTAMTPSLSSTSITSNCSLPPHPLARGNSETHLTKPKQRRASLSPDSPGRVFTCSTPDCCKQFKRSEHLKRHVRSVHTQEK
ncbi:hypothetical protein BGZ76_006346, partial [Entomortierella beljakovae]